MTESAIVAACLVALSRLPGVRVARMNTGGALIGNRVVRFGVPGLADICGIIAPYGRLLCVECKSPTGKQRSQQKIFERVIRNHGGIYILCRSADECLSLVRPFVHVVQGNRDP
jgi:hypothetical protein